ncbi:TonB-dependent receptor domain-containing protein [Sphingomonas sp.]|jgi:iron complex outermembrane receptor protein|uniref:TonB-dependent receptor domain-containing protein n=1 Tax=Sphingomonas sp. TaxID=28214 RepID=UPI002E36B4B0|nr:TonB-dependent receptor [Sphingomonas sp.]HEX4692917.1 TonB-dependent receptor [Sphingomonas sp.]
MAFFRSAPKLRLLTTAAPLGLIATLAATPAFAQTTQPTATPASATPADQATDDQKDDIVVTGTLFANATKTASPVTVVTAENLDRAGITNVSDAVRSISADGAGSIGNGFSSGFSAGGSAVSLRNLGVSSTITLIDGLRSANFPLNDDGHNNYVDLNSIPMANVESIQVLKDGASSLYGADAIGGVVNLITRKSFKGFDATVDAGVSERGEAAKYRARMLVGFGDYSRQGFNIYIGGDYERSALVTNDSLGFPFNTLDLRAIGGNDNNRADDTLTTATPNAVVTRTTQTDLNNPLAGSVANATTPAIFNSLTPIGNCPYGTFSENTSARIGTACAHDLQKEFAIFLPKQERYDFVGRASFRLGSSIEGYLAGSYANNRVDITRAPVAVRQTQAFGGSPATSTTTPGVVLPVYICAAGTNCATDPNRQLNPNNPYAAAFAANPAAGAARLYYLFGDIKSGSKRINKVYRVSGGLKGEIGSNWRWNIDSAYSRDNLDLTVYGNFNLAGLVKAINTGSYNFVNPGLNSAAVRNSVAPPINARSDSTEITADAIVKGKLLALPGGDLQLAVGGQFRREELNNRSLNPNLDLPGVSTAQAFGKRSVVAGFFELDAPILDNLDVNISGRYDHYSTGIGRFSPKATIKFQPVKGLALRGTYSEGFRAPTFAESNPLSSYSGFVGYTPNAAFVAAHPGNAGYVAAYSLGRGFVGNPNIQPEISRSYTAGLIVDPVRWLTFTADYYRVKKSNLIVTGPQVGDAITAYYSVANQSFASAAAAAAAGCAKVAAVAPGYSCNVIDGADPSALNALPRLLVVNAPYVNSAYLISSGLEFSLDARIPISNDIKLESRLDLQETLQYDLHPTTGPVQKYAGTVGPEDLSSGGGTPRWRGNWQNTLVAGAFSLTATTYYVGGIKAVAADQASSAVSPTVNDISCNAVVYKVTGQPVDKFCHVKSFIYTDLNLAANVGDQFTFSLTVGNVFGARAPLFANTAYSTQTNYLASWHAAGLIGRTFRAGARFRF